MPGPGQILVVTRFVVGGGTWLMPRTSGRLFGLDPDANPQAAYVGRLFGIRDAMLGAGIMATRGEARRFWLRVGIACDIADSLAGLMAWRAGEVPAATGAMLTGVAAGVASLGAVALSTDDS